MSPSHPLASFITITSAAPQAAKALSHPAHHYQAPTCSYFLSHSDLSPSLTTSIPRDSNHAAAFPLAPAMVQVLGPMLISILHPIPSTPCSLLSFPILAHTPGSAWPTLSSPIPSPKKRGAWCFPASLELWDASPLLPAQAHPLLPVPSRVERAAGAWGSPMGSCPPP